MFKNRLITSLLLVVGVFCVYASTIQAQTVLGARSLGLGKAQAALTDNEWALFGNPAMISSETKMVSFFGVRNFGFNELSDVAVALTLPTKYGTAGAGLHRFGDNLFSETRVRAAYKNSFMGFHYGGIINYTHNSIEGYGSDGAIGIDIGLAAQPVDGLWVGGTSTNINQPEIGTDGLELAQVLSFGFTYKILDRALVASDVVKDVRFPASYRGGIEIYIIEGLTGRAGVTTEPTSYTFGMGYETDNWGLNIGVQKHQVLDLSPGFDFKLNW